MQKAAGLAEKLLNTHKRAIGTLTLRPSIGGPFEVTVNGKLLFSKRASGRFPEEGEAETLVADAMGGA